MNTDISQCYSKYHGVHMIKMVLVMWYLKKTVFLLGAQHRFPSLNGQCGFVCNTWFYREHRLNPNIWHLVLNVRSSQNSLLTQVWSKLISHIRGTSCQNDWFLLWNLYKGKQNDLHDIILTDMTRFELIIFFLNFHFKLKLKNKCVQFLWFQFAFLHGIRNIEKIEIP